MPARSLSILLTNSAVVVTVTVFSKLLFLTHWQPRRGSMNDVEIVGKRVDNGKYEDLEDDVPTYDYVIVGGGTSGGAALAFSRIPAAFGQFMKSKHDFQLWTVPQPFAGGKSKYWPRLVPLAKLLGECSSVNAMMFHCGVPSDYDEWAGIMNGEKGAEKWKYEIFKKLVLDINDRTNIQLFTQGKDGPIGYFSSLSNIVSKFIIACQNVGMKLSHDVNNPASILGVTKVAWRLSSKTSIFNIYFTDQFVLSRFKLHLLSDAAIRVTYVDSNGRRSSTESAYLTPNVLSRSNLTVATHSPVTRILFEGEIVVGVEFARSREGPRHCLRARKECGCSSHTASPFTIRCGTRVTSVKARDCVHDLPGVGQNLTDHVVVQARFRSKPSETLSRLNDKSWRASYRRVLSVLQWQLFGRGPLSSNVRISTTCLFSPSLGKPQDLSGPAISCDPVLFPPDRYLRTIEEVASGPESPDLELYCGLLTRIQTPLSYRNHGSEKVPKGDLMTMSALLLRRKLARDLKQANNPFRPLSKGYISLISADPFDDPVIDPKYFEHTNDLRVLVLGMRLMLRIEKTEPLASLLVTDKNSRLDHHLDDLNEDALESIVRERAETPYHPACSARMATLTRGGVVDAELRVYGLHNLRIVDASVFLTIISGHTVNEFHPVARGVLTLLPLCQAAPCIAIAEFAADLIKGTCRASICKHTRPGHHVCGPSLS
ncbi:GMC oxidoreductase [Ramaria rubella]|nr:GMC oxidoreductase [Ramaria rubella]